MIAMAQLSSINFPRKQQGEADSAQPAVNTTIIETVLSAIVAGFPQKVKLDEDFLVSVFAPALFADDLAPSKLGMNEEQLAYWKHVRKDVKFGAETGINGSMVMPIYTQVSFPNGEPGPVQQIRPQLFGGNHTLNSFIYTQYQSFKKLLERMAYELTPTYDLYGGKDYKRGETITIRTSSGGDALAVVRHIFPDLQCDNDATIYDMIVTPIGTSRLVRVHSIDILPLGYLKTHRESEDERIAKAVAALGYRQDVLVEILRMVPKERISGMPQHERKVPQNAATGIMQFGQHKKA